MTYSNALTISDTQLQEYSGDSGELMYILPVMQCSMINGDSPATLECVLDMHKHNLISNLSHYKNKNKLFTELRKIGGLVRRGVLYYDVEELFPKPFEGVRKVQDDTKLTKVLAGSYFCIGKIPSITNTAAAHVALFVTARHCVF